MPLLSFLARGWLLRRLLGHGGGRHARRHAARRSGYGRSAYGRSAYGHRSRPHRPGGGFGMFGPFPTYSRRTRGGGRVSVGGCCLPIPLALAVAVAAATRLLAGRR